MPRLLKLTSPLGDGALIPTHFRANEQLGVPFSVEIVALAEAPSLNPSELLTKAVTLGIQSRPDEEPVDRYFHGLVAEFARLGPATAGHTSYRLVLVPGIWKLKLRQNCRIFQEKTVQDIVNAVLQDHGETASWGILPALEPMGYCTQFNETDLHFVSRLLEEHGLTYYYSHADGSNTLHISATAAGFPVFEGGSVKAVHDSTNFYQLSNWGRVNQARSAQTLFNDMDAERSQPSVVLNKTSATRTYTGEPAMFAAGEIFRWPGGMATRPGVDSAAVAMGEQETATEHYEAAALDPRFAAGVRVTVAVVAEDGTSESAQYVLDSVRHEATEDAALNAGSGGTESYGSTLSLVAASRTWMPKPRHERPVLSGLYSAKVTGPSGEKIHVDEFGRVKVKFRWDRGDATDDTTSCWIRVAQAAAGAWGGTWFLPRVGDEVLVAFLDGDPDRPVVTGSVYGKDAKPPFLPGTNRAQSGIKTRSYKTDSADDANILRFEDKKDSEEILLHAQKNLTVEVENDETRTVDHDQIETIKNSRTTTIKEADDTLTVEKGHRSQTIKTGNDTLLIETGNRSETLKTGNDTLVLEQGNRSATIKMGNETLTVEMGDESHTIKMGNLTVKCELGKITLEAMQGITLKVGETSSVVIDPSGITLKGVNIKQEATAMHETKGAIIKQDAQGPVMVNGAVVMLN